MDEKLQNRHLGQNGKVSLIGYESTSFRENPKLWMEWWLTFSWTMVMLQTALRTGARLSAEATSSLKFAITAMGSPRAAVATTTLAAPATTVFRCLATQATTATQLKRAAPTCTTDAWTQQRQPRQPTEQYSRIRNDGGGKVVNSDLIHKKTEDAIALIRKLEALRLVNVGGVPATSTESSDTSKEEYSAMNRNNRKPKRANHGARPCSRYSRRAKKRKWGNPRR
jgi:hypothetical protein